MTTAAVRTRNGRLLISQVKRMGKIRHWSTTHTRHVARMTLMCAMVESNLANYANANVHGSTSLPHDAVGYDHDSVGICQQRVGTRGDGPGGWGSLRHCQSVRGATQSFVQRLCDKGLDGTGLDAHRMGVACQEVQVSAFPDRYQAQYSRAGAFMHANFLTVKAATTPPPK